MSRITGHLISYSNPHFSGIASIEISSELPPTPESMTRAHIESGFGTRQLVAALGGQLNAEAIATYEINDSGLVLSVEPEE